MIYYKVKPTSDQIQTSIRCKRHILVINELYTYKEIIKATVSKRITPEFITANFLELNIKPINTFWFFGARFETSVDYSNHTNRR